MQLKVSAEYKKYRRNTTYKTNIESREKRQKENKMRCFDQLKKT